MTPRSRRLLAIAVLCVSGLRAAPAAAELPDLTAEEFKLYKDYQAALGDERVQKIPEAKRLAAIAKNFKVAEKALAAAVAKGEKAGAGAAKACEAETRRLLDEGPLKGRVREVNVDDAAAHVVTYVSWTNADGAKVEEEAALAALAGAKGTPIASTVAVWAVDAAGRKVFEAKIGAAAAGRFKADKLSMFVSRYIKQFEDVKNAFKGVPPPN